MSIAYRVCVHRLDPTIAELRLTFESLPAGVEVRGRLVGPRCPGVSTIEIAHALRPMGQAAAEYQVLIPDPCLWSAERPFVYEGPVDFHRDGVKVDSLRVSVSIKAPTGSATTATNG